MSSFNNIEKLLKELLVEKEVYFVTINKQNYNLDAHGIMQDRIIYTTNATLPVALSYAPFENGTVSICALHTITSSLSPLISHIKLYDFSFSSLFLLPQTLCFSLARNQVWCCLNIHGNLHILQKSRKQYWYSGLPLLSPCNGQVSTMHLQHPSTALSDTRFPDR